MVSRGMLASRYAGSMLLVRPAAVHRLMTALIRCGHVRPRIEVAHRGGLLLPASSSTRADTRASQPPPRLHSLRFEEWIATGRSRPHP